MKRSNGELHEDLMTTAETVQADAQDLARIEDEKRNLRPGDPRMRTLSKDAVRVAAGLLEMTKVEAALAERASDS